MTSHGARSPLLGHVKRDVALAVRGRSIAEGMGRTNPTWKMTESTGVMGDPSKPMGNPSGRWWLSYGSYGASCMNPDECDKSYWKLWWDHGRSWFRNREIWWNLWYLKMEDWYGWPHGTFFKGLKAFPHNWSAQLEMSPKQCADWRTGQSPSLRIQFLIDSSVYPLVIQHSYGKWLFIVDVSIKKGDFPYYHRVNHQSIARSWLPVRKVYLVFDCNIGIDWADSPGWWRPLKPLKPWHSLGLFGNSYRISMFFQWNIWNVWCTW